MVVIIDCGLGNLKSVKNALSLLGCPSIVSSDPAAVKRAKKIIFPGVGHFGQAVKELKRRRLFTSLKNKIVAGVPFLGICLGMQLLFEESQEAPGVKGLGIIDGCVRRFNHKQAVVPHMGWNQIHKTAAAGDAQSACLFKGIKDGSYFYFVHSYYCLPKDSRLTVTTTDYEVSFVSSIRKDNIWAFQFHAEKSQQLGLRLFSNFLSL